MHPKLEWVELLRGTLAEATGNHIVLTPRDHVDPLKKIIVFDMSSPLGKGSFNPFQVMVHAFAKANDCVVAAIRREGPTKYLLEILIKNRISPEMKNDPFLSDKVEKPTKEN